MTKTVHKTLPEGDGGPGGGWVSGCFRGGRVQGVVGAGGGGVQGWLGVVGVQGVGG